MWRKLSLLAVMLAVNSAMALNANAASRVLVLSGGDSPDSNHYSQYLQTKTLADELVQKLKSSKTSVNVMFGAGNTFQSQPGFADVHREINSKSSYVVGRIAGNQAATMENVQVYFNQLKLTPKDDFFLMVSDHGMPRQQGDYSDNCINLWNVDPSGNKRNSDLACLSVSQLKNMLSKTGARKTVFAMSQCFSGGFHTMSIESTPDGYPTLAKPLVCGFTATTSDETASGCTPDVEESTYKGYERYFTEQLTGKSIVTGTRISAGKSTLASAHEAALAMDPTKDMPLASSDYYLLGWTKAVLKPGFKARGKVDVSKVQAVVLQVLNTTGAKSILPQGLGKMESSALELVNRLRQQERFISSVNSTLQTLSSVDSYQELLNQKNKWAQEVTRARSMRDYAAYNSASQNRDNIRRILLYRRALAGAVALGLMGDEQAVRDFSTLKGCESTPLI